MHRITTLAPAYTARTHANALGKRAGTYGRAHTHTVGARVCSRLTFTHTRARHYEPTHSHTDPLVALLSGSCACVHRLPPLRLAARPGISLSLVLAPVNVVRHRRHSHSHTSNIINTSATDVYFSKFLPYYESFYVYIFFSFYFVLNNLCTPVSRVTDDDKQKIEYKKKPLSLPTFLFYLKFCAKRITTRPFLLYSVNCTSTRQQNDDGNCQIGVRQRRTSLFQV